MATLCQNAKVLQAETSITKQEATNMKVLNVTTSLHDNALVRVDDIAKSPNDKRDYRGLVLRNQLKVLLISDPTIDKSAASMDVNIGSMCDPAEVPGLAHFCEHMLFLGTEKYPEENEYTKYLSQNGGMCNAMTALDHTNYYFDVSPDKLEGALDRFSQFFLKPLFTESATERELSAVNSEHEKNIQSDAWRLDQLDKSSADPNHPFSKFGTGNTETLSIIPKEKGIDVRQMLLDFHNTWYSANIMSLSVLGKESLDELEKMVMDRFSKITNVNVKTPKWPEHPFNEEHFQTKWYIVPVKDIRNLNMSFPIPDMHKHYHSMPARYVAHLLGHEGEGSLLSILKAKGWSNSLVSGSRAAARGFNFFSVYVDLTEEGIKHVDDIITLTFQYINMLREKEPAEWIFNEYRDIAAMNFRFEEKSSSRSYVNATVRALQEYPMQEILTAQRLFSEWRPDLIVSVIGHLKPKYARIQVIGKQYEDIATEVEPWYGVKYKKERVPQNIIDKWNQAGVNKDLKLPAKNEFIPTNFKLKPREANADKFPIIIEDTPLMRIWFKQDDEYLLPKTNLTFDFVSPLAYMDPVNCNLTHMFVQLFRDSLNEYAYAAELAGLKWELSNSKYGMILGIGGYDDKQHVLLEKIINRMINFKVNPKRFEILKENYIRGLKNFEAEQPYQHAVYYLAVLLAEQVWIKDELLDAISEVTIEKLEQYIPQLLSKMHIECMVHGNMTKSEALKTMKLVETKLTNMTPRITPLLPKQLILNREVSLENGCHYLYEVKNNLHKSSCTEVYYQCNVQATESNMLLELLVQIIAEPCFNILRTKEQLGYIVFSGIRRTNGAQGLRVIVQSDKHPQYVEQRIESFMESMWDHISNMSEEEFNQQKESLATQRLEKPKMMSALSAFFWSEISTQQYNFDRANVEVAYLKTITQEQILKFFKEAIHNESLVRQKLSIHVISFAEGGAGLSEEKVPVDDTQAPITAIVNKPTKIEDVISFKTSQSLYPLPKPFINIPRKGTRSKL